MLSVLNWLLEQVGDVLNKLHQDAPNTPRESSSEVSSHLKEPVTIDNIDKFQISISVSER